ncbi:MAG TPA: peptidylprolyl isomerase [Thermoanaerobaculia bacterium]|nr:peptidylprolyl isomerase [Thermoanaerobaculia bacterium]
MIAQRSPGRSRGRSATLPLAAWFLLVAALSCGGGELAPGAVVRIGDRELDFMVFSDYVEEVTGEPGDALESAVLGGLFEQFVEEELLLSLARDRDLVGPQSDRRAAAAALLGSTLEVSDEELRRYYEGQAAELEVPERLRLQHLLFDDRAAAEQAEARLRAGEAIDRIAAELDALGFEEIEAALEDLPTNYAGMLFGLDPGAVVAVGDGFQHHVFAVLARRPAGRPAFEEAAPLLRRRLSAERARARRAELLDEARRRYNVQIAEARLPFALSPATSGRAASPAEEGSR